MVNKFIFTLTILFSGILATLQAQSHSHSHSHFYCGTSGEMAEGILKRLMANKAALKAGIIELRNDVVYVPIKFHVVGRDDGSQRVRQSRILDMLCATNEDFADQNIQFFIKGDFNYIDSDAVFENHRTTERGVMTFSKDNQAINVFLLEKVNDDPRIGGYYTSIYDWIVIKNSDVDNGIVLTHEVGHFFGIQHPFFGWENAGFEPTEAGERAPDLSPRGIPTEKVDGSNCEDAGDFICDTPADYNHLYPRGNCEFTETILDPDGIPIDPDEKLFMNYFNCSRGDYYFSPIQKELMKMDLASQRRRPLVVADPTTTNLVDSKPTNTFPANGALANISDGLILKWESVEDATRYLIEIDVLPNFSSPRLITLIASENSVLVDNLSPDVGYFWRVRPFNEYHTCQDFGAETTFRTTLDFVSSSNELDFVESWSVFPNPTTGSQINLSINSSIRSKVNVQLYNSAGQQVYDLGERQLLPGANEFNIEVDRLNSGVFTLFVTAENGYLSDRLVVLN